MTKREFLEMVIANEITTEVVEFAKERVVKLDEANSRKKNTLTATQKENMVLKEKILDFLNGKEDFVIANRIAEELEVSPNKVSALCRQLHESGLVTVEKVKGDKKGKVNGYKLA